MMRRDQMQREVEPWIGSVQAIEPVLLNVEHRLELVPVTVQHVPVERPGRLRVRTAVTRRVERPLPARRPLAFVMNAGGGFEHHAIFLVEAESIGDSRSLLRGPCLMRNEGLRRPGDGLSILSRRSSTPLLDDQPSHRAIRFGHAVSCRPQLPPRLGAPGGIVVCSVGPGPPPLAVLLTQQANTHGRQVGCFCCPPSHLVPPLRMPPVFFDRRNRLPGVSIQQSVAQPAHARIDHQQPSHDPAGHVLRLEISGRVLQAQRIAIRFAALVEQECDRGILAKRGYQPGSRGPGPVFSIRAVGFHVDRPGRRTLQGLRQLSRALSQPIDDAPRLGLEALGNVHGRLVEECFHLLALQGIDPTTIEAHRQIPAPHDRRSRLISLPAPQPGIHFRTAGVLDERRHRPRIDQRTSQGRMEGHRGGRLSDGPAVPRRKVDQRRGTGLVAAFRPRQLRQQRPYRSVAGGARVTRRFLLRGTLIDHQDASRPGTEAVHAAEPLHHALPGHQIADHVVRVEIDSDLTGGRRDQKHRRVRTRIAAGQQAMRSQFTRGQLPLAHPPPADEQDHDRSRRRCPLSPSKIFRNLLRHRTPVAVDQHARRLADGLGHPASQVPCPFGQRVLYRCVRGEVLDRERLRRVEPPPDGLVHAIVLPDRERNHRLRSRAEGRRQRQHPERRWNGRSHRRAGESPVRRVVVFPGGRSPTRLDRFQQSFERPGQMRLVQQHEGVAAEQPRLKRAHAP